MALQYEKLAYNQKGTIGPSWFIWKAIPMSVISSPLDWVELHGWHYSKEKGLTTNRRKSLCCKVRERGLEPPRPYKGHQVLSLAKSCVICIGLTGHLGCKSLDGNRLSRFRAAVARYSYGLSIAHIVSDLCQILWP